MDGSPGFGCPERLVCFRGFKMANGHGTSTTSAAHTGRKIVPSSVWFRAAWVLKPVVRLGLHGSASESGLGGPQEATT
jgi:hypothetical protein